jgi:NADH:ubiquinone oxidoreductase subunit 6 (subunit J)
MSSRALDLWFILLPAALGMMAIYLLLPRPRQIRPLVGALTGGAALVLAGLLLVRGQVATVETFLFYAFSGVAIVAGGMLITLRNPAHAALSFALVVLSTCGLFLLLAAPFLMAATIIIYTGAIIVTFLFVLMLAQQEGPSDADQRSREPFLSTVAGFVLLGAVLCVLNLNYDTRQLDRLLDRINAAAAQGSAAEMANKLGNEDKFFDELRHQASLVRGAPDRGSLKSQVEKLQLEVWDELKSKGDDQAMRKELQKLAETLTRVRDSYGSLQQPSAGAPRSEFSVPEADSTETVAPLGRALYTDYLLAVELGGMLLLVASIGAIAIAQRRGEGVR